MKNRITNTITFQFRSANQDIFEAIRHDIKKVETRAATKKYHNIKTGDTIIFSCDKKKFKKSVKKVRMFKTINAMLKIYSVKEIMPKLRTAQELTQTYYTYPNYKEKIKKYGIIALELK